MSCNASLANSLQNLATHLGGCDLETYGRLVRRRHHNIDKCVHTGSSRRFPRGPAMTVNHGPLRQSMALQTHCEIFF